MAAAEEEVELLEGVVLTSLLAMAVLVALHLSGLMLRPLVEVELLVVLV